LAKKLVIGRAVLSIYELGFRKPDIEEEIKNVSLSAF